MEQKKLTLHNDMKFVEQNSMMNYVDQQVSKDTESKFTQWRSNHEPVELPEHQLCQKNCDSTKQIVSKSCQREVEAIDTCMNCAFFEDVAFSSDKKETFIDATGLCSSCYLQHSVKTKNFFG